jgi:hypothetical protein
LALLLFCRRKTRVPTSWGRMARGIGDCIWAEEKSERIRLAITMKKQAQLNNSSGISSCRKYFQLDGNRSKRDGYSTSYIMWQENLTVSWALVRWPHPQIHTHMKVCNHSPVGLNFIYRRLN